MVQCNSLRKQPFLLAAGKAKGKEKAAVFTGYTYAGSTFNCEVKGDTRGSLCPYKVSWAQGSANVTKYTT